MQRNIDTLRETIHQYLERNSLDSENPPWEIRKSDLGGFGLFATRPIETGELIFKDYPVIMGPKAQTCSLLCVICYGRENLEPCVKECGLLLCIKCQNFPGHQKECKIIREWQTQKMSGDLSSKLVKVLLPIRSLLLSDEDKDVVKCLKAHKSAQHGFEVDVMKNILHLNLKEDEETFMRFVCCVMDSNAFEVVVGNENKQSSVKGLYSLSSLANHSCTPNTIHVFDHQQYMIVRAAKFIPQNAEIFHSYSRFIWGTPTRRFYLYRTKHFLCKCERCKDPTEFGTYISAIMCKVCKKGRAIPIDFLVNNGRWQCQNCDEIVSRQEVSEISSLLGATLNSFTNEDLDSMFSFLEKKLPNLVPENNETVVQIKYKIIWILGYQQGFKWPELSEGLLHTKGKLCRDLLTLLEMLNLGQCKMRGMLLHELYCCYKEMQRRGEKSGKVIKIHDEDINSLLLEAANILKYDVGAPPEVKKLWSDVIRNV